MGRVITLLAPLCFLTSYSEIPPVLFALGHHSFLHPKSNAGRMPWMGVAGIQQLRENNCRLISWSSPLRALGRRGFLGTCNICRVVRIAQTWSCNHCSTVKETINPRSF